MTSDSQTKEKRIVVLISGSGSNLQALLDAVNTPSLPNARIAQVISNRKNAFGLQRAAKHGVPTAIFNLKTWTTKTGKSRSDYDSVLARKVLLGGVGKSGDIVEGEGEVQADSERKGKQREVEGQDQDQHGQLPSTGTALEDTSDPAELPDLIILAGFMHILSPSFLEIISNAGKEIPCINLHPALPGQFDGSEAIERAFQAFKDGTLRDNTTGAMVHKVVAEVDRGQPIVIQEIKLVQEETLESLKEKLHAVEHRIIVEGARKILEGEA